MMPKQCRCVPLSEGFPVPLTWYVMKLAEAAAEDEGITPGEWASRTLLETMQERDIQLKLVQEAFGPANLLTGKHMFDVIRPNED